MAELKRHMDVPKERVSEDTSTPGPNLQVIGEGWGGQLLSGWFPLHN